jgi:hypothetical protein
MIVMASAMAVAAGLLAAWAWLAFFAWLGRLRLGLGLGGRSRFGFGSEETSLEFANLAFEEMILFFQFGFALHGALMLRSVIVGLLPQFNNLTPEPTHESEREEKENGEFAEASPKEPQQGKEIGLIAAGIEVDFDRRQDGYERALLGRKNNQWIGAFDVHAYAW